jgi:hypothetical protein
VARLQDCSRHIVFEGVFALLARPSAALLHPSFSEHYHLGKNCYTACKEAYAKRTQVLAGILFALSTIDTILIAALDLHNEEVNVLPVGPRILAPIFQAASARHTGTATSNLAKVNPAVQFSLLVMIYISIYPFSILIRMSRDYVEQPIGLTNSEKAVDDNQTRKTHLMNHVRNQLSFDLWYILLGVFCICICSAESERIMNIEVYMSTSKSIHHQMLESNYRHHCRHSPFSPSSSRSCLHTVTSVFHLDIRLTRHLCLASLRSLVSLLSALW